MAADYPAAVTTRLKTAVNNLTFSLTASVGIGDGTVYTSSTTGAPSAGSFHIENEVHYYTGKASDRFTGVLKGQDGTADAAHETVAGGNEVVFGPEAHHVNNLNEEMVAVQTELGKDLDNVVRIDGTNPLLADWDAGSFKITAEQLGSDIAIGTAPLIIISTTVVPNLNADQVDGLDGTDIAQLTATQTLTNKRITKRVNTIVSSATPTPAGDTTDIFTVTALAVGATFAAPTGTPINGQTLVIRIKDDGTARALAWNAIYREGSDVSLPTTTVISKTMYLGFIYSSAGTKWDLLAFIDNI